LRIAGFKGPTRLGVSLSENGIGARRQLPKYGLLKNYMRAVHKETELLK
jgi:hypothetical protein